MKVEQAIFTSAKTDRAAGYHVVAHSPGVRHPDLRELAVWCPSHDSLLDHGPDAMSINFHPLPSGSYCVSKTVPAGWEYSGRGGVRVYTHCLVVEPDVLAQFSNNPFFVLQAAAALDSTAVRDPIPSRLEPLDLAGCATSVDQTLLNGLSVKPGPKAMSVLVQTAIHAICLAVSGEPSPSELIAGFMNCIPLEARLDYSFSTGLKFSGRRPFHLIAVSNDPGEQRWIAHQNNVTVLDLPSDKPLPSIQIDGWARFIERVLASGRASFLAAELDKLRFDLKSDDLPALGLQLLEDLDESVFSESPNSVPFAATDPGILEFQSADAQADPTIVEFSDDYNSVINISDIGRALKDIQQAHAAHNQFEKSKVETLKMARLAVDSPSAHLASGSSQTLEKLELLDDLVFDAISGHPEAMEQFQAVWPKLRQELNDNLLAESREQYLRYALTIWEDCVDKNDDRNPSKAVQALDVLCMLFEE